MAPQKIKNHYKTIVIGGGIVGAGIIRDLALHKEECLLIDKNDFASQTSGKSSKMLHGGIRYLENFDFFLVFEALREKKIWLKLASHIASEKKFYLPVYKESKWPLSLMRVGLFLYDLLSLFKNRPYQVLSKEETLKQMDGLNPEGLRGSGVYSDGVIDDSKLVFDLIFDAIFHGAEAVNYHELTSLVKTDKFELIILNKNNDQESVVTCENIIFATGPFTDQVIKKLHIPWKDIILPSKGSHIWLKKGILNIKDSLVIQTKDGRVIFVIPQRNSILVGTTEVKLKKNDNFENLEPSLEEVNYLLESLNNYFPNKNINKDDILSTFSAVRPLVKSGINASKTSRKHKIYNPLQNMYVIAGGKYTTFRVMAQDVCKKIIKEYDSKLSKGNFKKKSLLHDIHNQKLDKELLDQIIEQEQVHSLEDLIKRRLSLYNLEQAEDYVEIENLIKDSKISLINQS